MKTFINIIKLADACWNGACNVSGLLISLGTACREIDTHEMSKHPAIRCIVGHINFLLGRGIGPEQQDVDAYIAWKLDIILSYANAIIAEGAANGATKVAALQGAGGTYFASVATPMPGDDGMATVTIHERSLAVSLHDDGKWAVGWL